MNQVIRASYGDHNTLLIVTEAVNAHLEAGQLDLVVTNDLAPYDPVSNIGKWLTLRLLIDGKRCDFSASENDRVLIPPN